MNFIDLLETCDNCELKDKVTVVDMISYRSKVLTVKEWLENVMVYNKLKVVVFHIDSNGGMFVVARGTGW